jgi:hypothetical protein
VIRSVRRRRRTWKWRSSPRLSRKTGQLLELGESGSGAARQIGAGAPIAHPLAGACRAAGQGLVVEDDEVAVDEGELDRIEIELSGGDAFLLVSSEA